MGKVLNRGDSLGLHRLQIDSFPFSAESSFRQLDDVFLQTQTRIWLGEVLKTRLEEGTSIADLLADGILLFEVSTVIWKMLLTKFMKLRSSKPYFSRSASTKNSGRYMPYSNVDAFLKICQMLGLTGIDLFSPSDVVEKRDIRRVCMCIRTLSKKARLKNINVPDFDVVTSTVAMPTDMVKGIRNSLERSQFRFSEDSSGCSAHLASRPKYGQKNWGADFARQYDSYSEESDNTDSNYQVVGFDSPISTTSCGGPSLLNSDLENSPRGSFVFHLGTSDINGSHTDSDESAGSSEHEKGFVFDLHGESDYHGPDSIYKTKLCQHGNKLFDDADLSSTAWSDFGKADTTDDEDQFEGKDAFINPNIQSSQHKKRVELLNPANGSTLNTDKLQSHLCMEDVESPAPLQNKERQLANISNDCKGPGASEILTPRSISACYICQSPASVSRDDGGIKCADCAIDDSKVSGSSNKGANENVKENLVSGDDGREAQSDQLKPAHQAWMNHEDVASSTEILDKETLEREQVGSDNGASDGKQRRRKLLLKSFAGGMSLVGVFLLLFHIRRPNGREKIMQTNVPPVQIRKTSKKENLGEGREQRSKPDGVYPAEKLRF